MRQGSPFKEPGAKPSKRASHFICLLPYPIETAEFCSLKLAGNRPDLSLLPGAPDDLSLFYQAPCLSADIRFVGAYQWQAVCSPTELGLLWL